MTDITKYIKKDYSERTKHLDLTTECREIGGNSTSFKGLLSHILEVTIPSSSKILLCHKCHNGKCSNPKHLYYGTPKENIQDQIENGTFISIWDRMVKKYGYEEACKRNSRGENAKFGGMANKGKTKSEEHKRKIAESIKNKHQKGEYENVQLGRKKSTGVS